MMEWHHIKYAPVLHEIIVFTVDGELMIGVLNQFRQFIQYVDGKAQTDKPINNKLLEMWTLVAHPTIQNITQILKEAK